MLEVLVALCQQALLNALWTSLPLLLVLGVAGWLGAWVQSVFQSRDPAVSHVPRVLALGVAAWALGPWIFQRWARFAEDALASLAAAR